MMKQFLLGCCALLMLSLTACDSWIDPDLNVDPTSPQDASFDVVLPTAQIGIGYVMGGDLGRYTSLLTQHNIGIDRQSLGLYQYSLNESDVDNAWRFNLYAGPMNDLYVLMGKADAAGAPHYKGVCQVLLAYCGQTCTDLWGDIPFTAAFGGAADLQPGYDSQEGVYSAIDAMLTDAIANLSAAESNLSPGSDDFIFGGDLDAWIKAAHGLKARCAIHLVKRDPSKAATAIAEAAQAMGSSAGDMQVVFGSVETEANPWYQFNTQRGDVNFGSTLGAMMTGLNDPRLPFYAVADDSGRYDQGLSVMGSLYATINSAVPLITYTEIKFIEAEAHFRQNNTAAAHAAYVDAVRASLLRSGVAADDASAYLQQTTVDPGAGQLTLEHIMTQKYIAMYTQAESWSDWRRTGFPTLTSTVQGSEIPRRFPYAQSERLYNSANMPAPAPTIFDRVWWDVP